MSVGQLTGSCNSIFPITIRYTEKELCLVWNGKESKSLVKSGVGRAQIADDSTSRTSGRQYRSYFDEATIKGGAASYISEPLRAELIHSALFRSVHVPTYASST